MAQQSGWRGPGIRIEAASRRRAAVQGQWLVAWRIQNQDQQPVEILSTWLPHDRFSSHPQTIDPPLRLLAKETARLELPVACNEPPGSVVENAFLILRLLWREEHWRALVRQRITLDDSGALQHVCEATTVHRVGFSAQSQSGSSHTG